MPYVVSDTDMDITVQTDSLGSRSDNSGQPTPPRFNLDPHNKPSVLTGNRSLQLMLPHALVISIYDMNLMQLGHGLR